MNTHKFQFVETPSCSVEESKNSLREYAKKRRVQNENRDIKEALLVKNFFKVYAALEEEITQSKGAVSSLRVFVYLSYSLEAPTDKLIEGLIEDGAKVFCPRIDGKELQTVEYGEDFSLNPLGIREPIGLPSEETPDVVVVPLLAVDEGGNRLGYGGGYYDRYLRRHDKAIRIGYCYDFQIIHKVPSADLDEKLDLIVTEKRILFPKRKG